MPDSVRAFQGSEIYEMPVELSSHQRTHAHDARQETKRTESFRISNRQHIRALINITLV